MRPVAEVLIDGDIVAALIGGLDPYITPPLSGDVPTPRPASFVTLKLLGGAGRANTVTSWSTITYEAWAKTAPDANTLAQLVRAHLLAFGATVLGTVTIYRVNEVGAPGNLPDPDSAQARFVGTVEICSRLSKP